MLKYTAVAAASKAFSVNNVTRRAYRVLGNKVLERMRLDSGIPAPYLDRAVRLLETCDRYSALAAGDRVLELGTGWVHWEATILRLFHDVEVTLYDVVDNRLPRAYRAWLGQLRDELDGDFGRRLPVSAERLDAARALADRALRTESYDELYALMGFRYVLDPSGMLAGVPPNSYALVVSADVLEHVPARTLPTYLDEARERLLPGGLSVHQIDLVDHFTYFDPTCSKKNYYRYTDESWRRWFDSDVQYINRVQCPEWRALFADAGFEAMEEDQVSEPLPPHGLAPEYADLSAPDRECMQMLVVHRRSERTPASV
ncbi:class I SAM-dependent methyltransferase [Actinomycetospora sp. TBRC 11914]|uniref:class I SAM-dependent methyltransferase n=1 Tax=Actinomycetospora sp. TBRC 11914 TaxID=2729387 RepID=UPI00145DD8DC|nr:class I SAM-dependent methyltransferase [Actinomycetospora sp. TBRC 11914]NMO90347.1 class I SAM-dependent methyltransferase [Actinomycetospora sp. TBRC 11914]